MLNRLVRDMLVERAKAFFPRCFAPVTLVDLRPVDTDIPHVRGPDILLVSRIHGNVPFRSTISTCRALSPLRNVVFRYMAAFLLSSAWRDLTRRLRFNKRFIRSREV